MNTEIVKYLDGNNGVTQKIKRAMYDAAKQFVYIGFLLWEVQEYGYYKEHGYQNVYEYAEMELNFKRTSTKNFINVATTFGNYYYDSKITSNTYLPTMNLKPEYENFNYSQLTEMLAMSPTQRKKVTPDMTVKQIRQMKQQAGEDLKADNYTIPEVTEANTTLTEEPTKKDKSKHGQTSDQKETVVLNNVWKELTKETLKELVKVSGIKDKKKYEIKIKGEDENKYNGMRYYPEWVAVNERLPKEEEIVLVVTKTKTGVRNINRAYHNNGIWHGSGSMAGVTHWMRMPDLPEED